MGRNDFRVEDVMLDWTAPLLAAERSRINGSENHAVADGVYRVLATLNSGGKRYRIFAELLVDGGDAQLRFHRFEAPARDEWFAEQKINVSVARPEIVPLEEKINGADFVLCAPVRLDENKIAAIFGSSGPPAT
jgi:hypothetical protein